jgi:hypothetical protein
MILVVIGTNVAILALRPHGGPVTGEIAVRTALGASRGRIVAQLFTEALVLSIAAALVGIAGCPVRVPADQHAPPNSGPSRFHVWMHYWHSLSGRDALQ